MLNISLIESLRRLANPPPVRTAQGRFGRKLIAVLEFTFQTMIELGGRQIRPESHSGGSGTPC